MGIVVEPKGVPEFRRQRQQAARRLARLPGDSTAEALEAAASLGSDLPPVQIRREALDYLAEQQCLLDVTRNGVITKFVQLTQVFHQLDQVAGQEVMGQKILEGHLVVRI